MVLRVREPKLKRGVPRAGRYGRRNHLRDLSARLAAAFAGRKRYLRETILGNMNGLLFGMVIVVAGFAMYYATRKLQARTSPPKQLPQGAAAVLAIY